MTGKLTAAGLGPGGAGLITRETWTRIEEAGHILLRTRIHPAAAALDEANIFYETYDAFYDAAKDFDELYEAITNDLLVRTQETDILYLVPGSPFVAERTIQLLREKSMKAGNLLEIFARHELFGTALRCARHRSGAWAFDCRRIWMRIRLHHLPRRILLSRSSIHANLPPT